jgi:hypothetical protein
MNIVQKIGITTFMALTIGSLLTGVVITDGGEYSMLIGFIIGMMFVR